MNYNATVDAKEKTDKGHQSLDSSIIAYMQYFFMEIDTQV